VKMAGLQIVGCGGLRRGGATWSFHVKRMDRASRVRAAIVFARAVLLPDGRMFRRCRLCAVIDEDERAAPPTMADSVGEAFIDRGHEHGCALVVEPAASRCGATSIA